MGEVADMMREGVLCQECGVFLGEDASYQAPGYPVTCNDCKREARPKRKRRKRSRSRA